ncbi:MAG: hypothetical protein M9897_05680 [Brumimicrobium sp.]|nr:hypothetical protein [Brumimicrobium sp.]
MDLLILKEIRRTFDSEKKNIIFEYDAFGNQIAKHVYNSNTLMLERSTYYLLDAQGNQLSIYEHSVDTATNATYYYLTERNIYGSSRLGATKEAVNMQNPSLLPSYGILGNRNYELSDHRGNVQTVINDIKYPLESNGNITSYEVGISQITDYSPFGAPLDGRTIENIFHYPNSSVDTLFVSDTLFVINNDFENPVITTNGVSTFIDGWKDFSQSTISIENTGGNNQLKVVSTNGTHGIHQTFAIENGETYTFEVDLTKVSVPFWCGKCCHLSRT